MSKIFDSIYVSMGGSDAVQQGFGISINAFLIMLFFSLSFGFLYSFILSFKMRTSRRMFSVISILPAIVGSIITFVNGNIGAGVAIGGAFALIRFRSAQGTADELVAIFTAMAAGVAFGMGYCAYGVLTLILFGLMYVVFSSIDIFNHRSFMREKILKITIPETLGSIGEFDDIFKKHLVEYEFISVRTVGMGSMYRIAFRIVEKKFKQEKEMIDEIRERNGNLEISISPYSEENHL